jgi:glucan endo-1,3-beta-D-glucosidase
MRFSTSALATAAIVATANAAHKGFNYGAFFLDQRPKHQADFEYEFKAAKQLVGTNSQFTSARLYTMVQWQTTNTVIEAIQAAINTKTTLLLGLWASSGTTAFNNEIVALKAAIAKYGTSFTDLVVGISVGSEDLYRISPTGISNKGGPGANPKELINYIAQTRAAIKGTGLASKPIGHVDTWTAYVNGSNSGVIAALDFIGVDAYPYWETTTANSIGNANASFYDAYKKTVTAAKGKPVWVTEAGWPVSGPKQNQAVASPANARIFWQDVSCSLMKNNVHLYYYTLQDAQYGTPSPSFGIKPAGDLMAVKPLFDLTCPAKVSYLLPLFLLSILSPLFLLFLYNASIVASLLSPILSAKYQSCSCDRTIFISPSAHLPVWAKRPSDWCARANGYAKDPSVIPSASLISSSTNGLTSISMPSASNEI